MKYPINIKKIVVMLTDGTDRVSIYTDLPSPYPAEVSTRDLIIEFQTTINTGVDYIREHFDCEPKILNVRIPHKTR